MTHVYYHPIKVTLTDGKPATIHWRGLTYHVLEVNEPWRLADRWWEPAGNPSTPGAGNGHSDRTYYRLRCISTSASAHEDLTCDIYFEAVGAVWILERVYD